MAEYYHRRQNINYFFEESLMVINFVKANFWRILRVSYFVFVFFFINFGLIYFLIVLPIERLIILDHLFLNLDVLSFRLIFNYFEILEIALYFPIDGIFTPKSDIKVEKSPFTHLVLKVYHRRYPLYPLANHETSLRNL